LQVRVLSHLPDETHRKPRKEPGRAEGQIGRRRKETMNAKIRWYKRFVNFLKETKAELKKVTWPSKNEVTSTTIVVIIATVFFGFYLFFMDVLFSFVIKQIKTVLG
jgi:preprotein translocase subunit SecE